MDSNDQTWRLVREYYVKGLMKGEDEDSRYEAA